VKWCEYSNKAECNTDSLKWTVMRWSPMIGELGLPRWRRFGTYDYCTVWCALYVSVYCLHNTVSEHLCTTVQHQNVNSIYSVKLHPNETKTFLLILETRKGLTASAQTKWDLEKSRLGDSRQQCNKMGNAGITQKLIGVLSIAFPNLRYMDTCNVI